MQAQLLWYGLVPSTQKIYTKGRNSYTEYCTLFGKTVFPAQVGELAV